MVRKEGVEPSLREPQSLVLPLHYIGDKWWAIRDSNPNPTVYETVAPTNCANGPN